LGFLTNLGRALREVFKADAQAGGPITTTIVEGLTEKKIGRAAVATFRAWPGAKGGLGAIYDARRASPTATSITVTLTGEQADGLVFLGEKMESGAARLNL
jgi:hypothetical protein